jgi:hypothetical protein
MKHTKGEWGISGGNSSKACVIVKQMNGDDTFWTDVFTANEREANAKLIACAPELLKACQEMMVAIYDVPKEFVLTEDMCKACDIIEKTIKKATE